MISIFTHGDKFMIVQGAKLLERQGITGSRGRLPGVPTFDECWTGDHWAPQASFGLKFDSREEAQAYLDEHFAELESQ
jgi:hypothetical protein